MALDLALLFSVRVSVKHPSLTSLSIQTNFCISPAMAEGRVGDWRVQTNLPLFWSFTMSPLLEDLDSSDNFLLF